jgi:hypothetical protein
MPDFVFGTREPIDDTPIEPFKDQFIYSVALSRYLREWDTKWIAELYGSFPLESQDNTDDLDVSSLEALFGIKYDVNHNLAAHFGGGTEILSGAASPDWRLYAGVNYAFGPLFKKPIQKKKDIFGVDPFSGPIQDNEEFTGRDVLFDFASSQLSLKGRRALGRLAESRLSEKFVLDPPSSYSGRLFTA